MGRPDNTISLVLLLFELGLKLYNDVAGDDFFFFGDESYPACGELLLPMLLSGENPKVRWTADITTTPPE